MRNTIATIIFILLTLPIIAQSPEKLSYQAVIRDNEGQLVQEQTVSIRISILKNSANGTIVYSETQSRNTNTNGLVTLEIGNGIAETGNFSNIDWSSGMYYLKTEIDLQGGTNYTITGTSQLLSVPYALHAKTAQGLSNLTGIATQNALNDTASAIRSDMPKVKTYSVGDFAQGGVVFWVDETGQHGLVCAKEDQSSGIRWYAGTEGATRAGGDGPFSGKTNTAIIIAAQIAIGDDGANYAARVCNELQVTENEVTYGDWYLPSKLELSLLFQQKDYVGEFADARYWTSTEHVTYINSAWITDMGDGGQVWFDKSAAYHVRAIRAF